MTTGKREREKARTAVDRQVRTTRTHTPGALGSSGYEIRLENHSLFGDVITDRGANDNNVIVYLPPANVGQFFTVVVTEENAFSLWLWQSGGQSSTADTFMGEALGGIPYQAGHNEHRTVAVWRCFTDGEWSLVSVNDKTITYAYVS